MSKNNKLNDTVTREYLDFRLDVFKQQVDEMLKLQTDVIFTRIDPILREVESAREDRAVVSQQTAEIREELTEHDHRISKLENPR